MKPEHVQHQEICLEGWPAKAGAPQEVRLIRTSAAFTRETMSGNISPALPSGLPDQASTGEQWLCEIAKCQVAMVKAATDNMPIGGTLLLAAKLGIELSCGASPKPQCNPVLYLSKRPGSITGGCTAQAAPLNMDETQGEWRWGQGFYHYCLRFAQLNRPLLESRWTKSNSLPIPSRTARGYGISTLN